MTWATGSKANRRWIYLLTFCLGFYIAFSVAMFVFVIETKAGWKAGINAVVLSMFLNGSTLRAIQRRRLSSASDRKNLADIV